MEQKRFRSLEINGGTVRWAETLRLEIPAARRGYADAQIDDYGNSLKRRWMHRSRADYPWRPSVRLCLRARFSHPGQALTGTAGFGFWNAPFGDPTVRWPALPQACWFFFASEPSDLPLNLHGAGQGWFVSTLDMSPFRAISLAPLMPLVVLLNQVAGLRRRIWPVIRRSFNISYLQLEQDMGQWHDYELCWRTGGCTFLVDGETVLETPHTPRGPLGFVCWLDNQYLVLTSRGRFAWGVLPVRESQWLEVDDLRIESTTLQL